MLEEIKKSQKTSLLRRATFDSGSVLRSRLFYLREERAPLSKILVELLSNRVSQLSRMMHSSPVIRSSEKSRSLTVGAES